MDPSTIERETIGRLECVNQTQDLTFMDGVLATWGIFDRILRKQLEGEKCPEGFSYLDSINDDVTDLLLNRLLEQGYFLDRRDALLAHFGINPDIETNTPTSTLPKPSQAPRKAVSDDELKAFYSNLVKAIDALEYPQSSLIRAATDPPLQSR